jgi:hypothetical protein
VELRSDVNATLKPIQNNFVATAAVTLGTLFAGTRFIPYEDFENIFRADGWLPGDFQFRPYGREPVLSAWTLSDKMRKDFVSWLANDRRPCPGIERLRSSTSNNPELAQTLVDAVSALQQQFAPELPLGSHDRNAELDTVNTHVERVHHQTQQHSVSSALWRRGNECSPLQRIMLNDCLKYDSELLRRVDPSRDPRAEETYSMCKRWFLTVGEHCCSNLDAGVGRFLFRLCRGFVTRRASLFTGPPGGL